MIWGNQMYKLHQQYYTLAYHTLCARLRDAYKNQLTASQKREFAYLRVQDK
jgi:hypothetical protein